VGRRKLLAMPPEQLPFLLPLRGRQQKKNQSLRDILGTNCPKSIHFIVLKRISFV